MNDFGEKLREKRLEYVEALRGLDKALESLEESTLNAERSVRKINETLQEQIDFVDKNKNR